MDIKTVLAEPAGMDYVDAALNSLLGFIAPCFILQDRKTPQSA